MSLINALLHQLIRPFPVHASGRTTAGGRRRAGGRRAGGRAADGQAAGGGRTVTQKGSTIRAGMRYPTRKTCTAYFDEL